MQLDVYKCDALDVIEATIKSFIFCFQFMKYK